METSLVLLGLACLLSTYLPWLLTYLSKILVLEKLVLI